MIMNPMGSEFDWLSKIRVFPSICGQITCNLTRPDLDNYDFYNEQRFEWPH